MSAVALLLAACLSQDGASEKGVTPCRELRPSEDPEVTALLKPYAFAEKEFSWELRETARDDKVAVAWLTFPSALQGDDTGNNTVWAKLWRPLDEAEGRPAAVLLHWLGGDFTLLELIGRRMAERGIVSLMMYLPHYGPRRSRDPGKRDRFFGTDMEATMGHVRQAVLDTRRAGDWLAARPDVEPTRVGIVGISLGAVIGSLAAGVDDRFGRSVFVIGGGDLPGIILNGSRETERQKRMLEGAGLTPEKMREAWKGIEPLTFAFRMRDREILMINAEKDEVIPRAGTEKLAEAIGNPEVKWLPGGHYAVMLKIGTILTDIVKHLNARTSY